MLAVVAADPFAATWDLGRLKEDEVAKRVFPVNGESGASWQVEGVEVSCDCVEIAGRTFEVPAGGMGEIALDYHPAGPGFVEEWVEVSGHDGQGREVKRRYRLTGRVSPDPALCLDETVCKAILENPLLVLVVNVRGGQGVTAVTISDTGT